VKAGLWIGLVGLSAVLQLPAQSSQVVDRGVINGLVRDITSPSTVVSGVVVELSSGRLPVPLVTVVDGRGRFTFSDLPPGVFRVRAYGGRFLRAEYGAPGPGREGIPLHLENGGAVSELVVSLFPSAVIAGRLLDERGKPVPWQRVTVRPMSLPSATDTVVVANDIGEYRAAGLAPGTYEVCARRIRQPFDMSTQRLTEQVVDAVLAELQVGGRPASVPSRSGLLPADLSDGLSCYPGGAVAQPVRVGLGQVAEDIDILEGLLPVSNVVGKILVPAGVSSLRVFLRTSGLGRRAPSRPARVAADGTFELRDVAVGDYEVVATGVGSNASGGERLFAAVTSVGVSGNDVSGLVLPLGETQSTVGRIVVESADTVDVDLAAVTVSLGATDDAALRGGISLSGDAAVVRGLGAVPVSRDGRFEIRNIVPGVYQLKVSGLTDGFWVSGIELSTGDRGAGDAFLHFPEGSSVSVTVRVRSASSGVVGRLSTPLHERPEDFVLVLFAVDRRDWTVGQRRQVGRPSPDGHFEFRTVPSGDYYLAALPLETAGSAIDSSLLELLAESGVAVSLSDSATKTVNITIARQRQ